MKYTNIITLLLLFLFIHPSLHSKERFDYLVQNISTEGLEGCQYANLMQDNLGYMWIGGQYGLNCYDGYRNIPFITISGENGSLNNWISCLEKDSSNRLWVGKEVDYPSILNLSTRQYLPIKYQVKNKSAIPFYPTVIKSIKKNEVWIGTHNGKVYKINDITPWHSGDSMVLMSEEINATPDFPTGCCSTILPIEKGVLVGFEGGAMVYINNTAKKNVKKTVILTTSVFSTCIDHLNRIWVGTKNGVQVLEYHPSSQGFTNITSHFPDLKQYQNTVLDVKILNQSLIFATDRNGLFIYQIPSSGNKGLLTNYTKENSALLTNRIHRLHLDQSNKLWIGTQNEGVSMIDFSQKRIYSLTLNDANTKKNEITVLSVLEDHKNRVWIGTKDDGLYCYDKLSGKTVRSEYQNANTPPIANETTVPNTHLFTEKAIHVVYENINNPTFDVMQFCSAMEMSYTNLHRKLKATLDLTATDFIRTLKMKRAAELLQSGNYRVSEVMFEVGFDDPSHFAKTFRHHFGKTPTEYLEEKKEAAPKNSPSIKHI